MGTAVSRKKSVRSDAISSVAAKVRSRAAGLRVNSCTFLHRAARAFGEYLSNTHPENRNGADHLLSDTFPGQDSDSPDISHLHNNNLSPQFHSFPVDQPNQSSQFNPSAHQHSQPLVNTFQAPAPLGPSKRRLSVERSLSAEDPRGARGPEDSVVVESARVYTITREAGMTLRGCGSEESLELEVLKGSREQQGPANPNPSCTNQPSATAAHGNHHRSSHHRSNHHPAHQHHGGTVSSSQPLQSSGNANNIRAWGMRKEGSRDECTPECIRAPCQSQRSLDLDTSPRDGGKHRKKLERMYSEDRASSDDRAFADRRAKSFSRSWSDPTPVKPDSLHDSRDRLDEDAEWEDERDVERAACEGEDFIPPKIMLISSKVPKAEYVPNIIRRDDPSIIPILYDHEHATFDDILEEIEKKLTAYRKGCKIWNMLIFCQGGPGHLYLLKNKVATFAKVEKEDDMIQFWRRLSRLMSKLNPNPNLIHIMGCYVLGSANGEKLIQTLKKLMRPTSVEFKSPLELSAQGKEMIEMYFDFRLFRLWKSRQHSKLLDYDDLL
ncbi:NMDA receptor synaptonuclear signaling and neuronal migration factor [Channa argus]|uniref:NMDA receptor synaptonuclear signaling and neuronal migration factor n=1 Tax=Channa argus TaxID=215402 RepID=A0A6G1Q1F7_CHAAH|nr:NMDA receptor synaptonuclear signaling and neuronal migration factor [Channa argus]